MNALRTVRSAPPWVRVLALVVIRAAACLAPTTPGLGLGLGLGLGATIPPDSGRARGVMSG